MNALEKLIERQANGENLTSLEFAVFWCSDLITGIKAAEELAAKDAETATLREQVTKLESICRMVINGEHCDNDGRGCGASTHVSFELGICPVCTWRGDVTLRDGVCPYCKTDWNFLREPK